MRKVTLTIRTERTLVFHIDETKIDQEFIEEWDKHITDIKGEPESYERWMEDSLPESMFPYVNLAENMAYAIHVNDDDHIEGLRFQDITYIEAFECQPDRDPDIPVYYEREGYLETEYELHLDETDTEE